MLRTFEKLFHEENIYLFDTPHERIRPGALVIEGQVVQHLTDIKGFFEGTPHLSEPLPASTKLQNLSTTVSGGGGIGAGLPGIASVELVARHSREVTVTVVGVVQRYLYEGSTILGEPALIEAADWCHLANRARDILDFSPFYEKMQRRRWGLPSPREVDIAESLVYIQRIEFKFHTDTDISADVQVAQLADVKAGLKIDYDGRTSLTWENDGRIPFGFTPVRYAWQGLKGRLELVAN